MSDHRIDYVSLVGAIVFLSFGLVGLLRSAGWIDNGAGFWALIAIVGGLGSIGAFSAIRGLAATQSESHDDELVLAEDP